jgi:hypothetical protein
LVVLFRKENFLFWKLAQELKPKDSNEYWNEQYKNFMVNLYMQANNTSPSLDLLFENTHIHLIRLRKELVNFFQELLLGDALAAEYLLMHLLSSV